MLLKDLQKKPRGESRYWFYRYIESFREMGHNDSLSLF